MSNGMGSGAGCGVSVKGGTSRYKFLKSLSETGSVRIASEVSGKARSYWLKKRLQDNKFACAWDHAVDAYIDILETEADRRALLGDEDPIFYGGKQVGVRSKPSDRLLMFRLKALRPSQYKDSGCDEGPQIKVEVQSFLTMKPSTPRPESKTSSKISSKAAIKSHTSRSKTTRLS